MMPLLPMPVTTTRPRDWPHCKTHSTARSKSAAIAPSSRSARASSASASMRTKRDGVSAVKHSMLSERPHPLELDEKGKKPREAEHTRHCSCGHCVGPYGLGRHKELSAAQAGGGEAQGDA